MKGVRQPNTVGGQPSQQLNSRIAVQIVKPVNPTDTNQPPRVIYVRMPATSNASHQYVTNHVSRPSGEQIMRTVGAKALTQPAERQSQLLNSLQSSHRGSTSTETTKSTGGTTAPSVPKLAKKSCNCSKSHCLKLYCDCFASGDFCSDCNCTNCFNNLDHEQLRMRHVHMCLLRNPEAFRPKIGEVRSGVQQNSLLSFSSGDKNGRQDGSVSIRAHKKGCNCKRSGCFKNYCECFEARIPCTDACRCMECRNQASNYATNKVPANDARWQGNGSRSFASVDLNIPTEVSRVARPLSPVERLSAFGNTSSALSQSSAAESGRQPGESNFGTLSDEEKREAEMRRLRAKSLAFKLQETMRHRQTSKRGLSFLSLAKSLASSPRKRMRNDSTLQDEPPYHFITEAVCDAICQCLLARAEEALATSKTDGPERGCRTESDSCAGTELTSESMSTSANCDTAQTQVQALIIEEFGRCLQKIVDMNDNK